MVKVEAAEEALEEVVEVDKAGDKSGEGVDWLVVIVGGLISGVEVAG